MTDRGEVRVDAAHLIGRHVDLNLLVRGLFVRHASSVVADGPTLCACRRTPVNRPLLTTSHPRRRSGAARTCDSAASTIALRLKNSTNAFDPAAGRQGDRSDHAGRRGEDPRRRAEAHSQVIATLPPAEAGSPTASSSTCCQARRLADLAGSHRASPGLGVDRTLRSRGAVNSAWISNASACESASICAANSSR